MSGRFITLEGGEGSGKTTQLALLESVFHEAGLPYARTREPGGTIGAESLRRLLLDKDAYDWDAKTETLLFYAARLDHLHRLIFPALKQGTHVLCDRFADSTLVYQGIAKGVKEPWLQALHQAVLGSFAPDLTLVLDIPVETGLTRAHDRQGRETRFEALGTSFHENVRQGFLNLAARDTQRCAVIDASGSVTDIHYAIIKTLNHRLELQLNPIKDAV